MKPSWPFGGFPARRLLVLVPSDPPDTRSGTRAPKAPAETGGAATSAAIRKAGPAKDAMTRRTREVKHPCCFPQTITDDEGYPVRDPDSSTAHPLARQLQDPTSGEKSTVSARLVPFG